MFQLNLSHGKHFVTLLQAFVGLSVIRSAYDYIKNSEYIKKYETKATPNFTNIFSPKIEMTAEEFEAFVEKHASADVIRNQLAKESPTQNCFCFGLNIDFTVPYGQLSRMVKITDNDEYDFSECETNIEYGDRDRDRDREIRLTLIAEALVNEKQAQYAVDTNEFGTFTYSTVPVSIQSKPSLFNSLVHVAPCALGAAASAFMPNDTAKVLVSGIGAVASLLTTYALNRDNAGAERQ